jgi:hypothetical protein
MVSEPAGQSSPSRTHRDWWDKAAIISGFVSSVVIALIGILISYSIQHAQLIASQKSSDAQITIAKLKANDDRRLQEGQLTAQFVQHLVSKEPVEREIAVVALRASIPSEVFEPIVVIIARSDSSIDVRARAIEQLSRSSSPTAAATLAQIAYDSARPSAERNLAASSTLQVGVRQAVARTSAASSTFVLASANANGLALDVGRSGYSPFAEAVLRGLGGAADDNGDRLVSGSELGRYVATTVPLETRRMQQPIWLTKGIGDIVLGPPLLLQTRSKNMAAIVIGVADVPSYPRLVAPDKDIHSVAALFRQAGASTTVLLNKDATKSALRAEISRVAQTQPYDLFVFYYTGFGTLSKDGVVRWILGGSETLSATEINEMIDQVSAKNKAVFVDSNYAGAVAK